MNKKIASWLLYITLFLLPLQTRWIISAAMLNDGPWEYGTISLYAVDILILIAFIFHIAGNRPNFRVNAYVYRCLVAALAIILIASIPFSLLPLLSGIKVAMLLVSILLVYILAKTSVYVHQNALALVSGAAVSGLLGVWQFLNQFTFASKWFGLAMHDSSTLGASVIEAVAPDGVIERWLRAYGSLDHPNMFGGLMAIALVIASWLWLSRREARTTFEYAAIIASTVFLTAGLIVSFSRASWIAAAIGLAIVAIHYLCKRERKWSEFFAWAATLAVVAGLLTSQYYYLFTPRFSGDTRLEQISQHERLDAGGQSLDLIKQKPLLGFGAGTYTLAVSQEIRSDRPSWFYQPVHNVFLLMAAEIGLVGTLIFVAALIAFLIFLWRRQQSSSPLLLAIPLAMLAIALFDHWPFSLHFGIVFSGALLGLLANNSRAESLTE